MGSKFSSGFTIIEVMLFLAITGLMIAGVLANANRSVNEQHYRDGVETVRNVFASEYAKVYNLTNSAEGRVTSPCEDATAESRFRGTSNCLYVGRLIQISPDANDGSNLRISPVVAKPVNEGNRYDNTTSSASSAVEGSLRDDYTFRVYDSSAESENSNLTVRDSLPWSLAAVRPGASGVTDRMSVDFLILRSPIDGTVRSYNLRSLDSTSDPDIDSLSDYMTPDHLDEIRLCIADLGGGYDPVQRMAVIIGRGATSAADIETLSEGSGC